MSKEYLIWDLPLRIFHWCFVIVLSALWYTSDQDVGLIELHMKLGYFALFLVLFRLIWGVVGTKHAKFINFLPNYIAIKTYLLNFNKAKHYAGHNPIGSLMVFLMLFLALSQAISGLFINDDIFSSGPYYGTVSESLEKVFNFIHRNAFDVLAIAALIHVLAVLYYVRVKKQPLIKAIIHGKKRSPFATDSDQIKHSRLLIALVVAGIVAVFIYWLVVLNAPIIEEYYY